MKSAGAAFGRAALVAGGTMVFLGGSTVLVSGVAMTAAKVIMDKNQKVVLEACRTCNAKARVACEVCEGERILRLPDKDLPAPRVPGEAWNVCTMCEGSGEQRCPNCLGSAEVYPTTVQLPGAELIR